MNTARLSNEDPMELSPVVDKAGHLLGLRAAPEFREKDQEFCGKFDEVLDIMDAVRYSMDFIDTPEELVAHLRRELSAASGDPRKVKPAGKLLRASRAFASDVLRLPRRYSRHQHEFDQAAMLYCNIVFLTTEFRVSQVLSARSLSPSFSRTTTPLLPSNPALTLFNLTPSMFSNFL